MSHVQMAVFVWLFMCDEINRRLKFINTFSPCKRNTERKGKIPKDEKKHHSTVDESLSDVNRTQLSLLCEKSGTIYTPSASGSYDRQAGR